MSDMCKCKSCGSVYPWDEVEGVTVYEDYGDVGCLKCPKCGRIQYDGEEFIVDAEEEDK